MEITLNLFLKMVLFLELLGVLLASSILNENHPTVESASFNFKYYSNRKGSKVVEVDRGNRCHVFENGHASWMLETRKAFVTSLNPIQFQILLQKCLLDPSQQRKNNAINEIHNPNTSFGNENDFNQNLILTMLNESIPNIQPGFNPNSEFLFNVSDVNNFMSENNSIENSKTPLIFPGTRWCGRGNISRSNDDIGIYAETDKCCRSHDQCPENIEAKQCKHNLCNEGSYTRSHCDCDEKFLQCLDNDRSLSSLTSFKIANLYFNILKPNCFASRHPVNACRRRRLSGECVAFQYNFQMPITWQFFPAQPYIVREARNLLGAFISPRSNPRPIPTSIPLPDSVLFTNDVGIPNLGISQGIFGNTLSGR